MGSAISKKELEQQKAEKEEKQKAEKEDKRKRKNLELNLRKMQRSLHVTAHAHYVSSEYYRKWNIRLQYMSLVVGAGGATGGLASTFNWKAFVGRNPRLAPLVAAFSVTSAILPVTIHLLPRIQSMPATLYEMHFNSGIECQYLEKKVKFMSETEVWDSKILWASLASKYETLLRDKKDVNSVIQTEEWAYRKALRLIEEREREKRNQTVREEEGTMQ